MRPLQEAVGIDPVMQHQAGQRRSVVAIILLLQPPCVFRGKLQQLGHEGRHVAVNLREQVDVMRVKRVVQVEDPVAHVSEIRSVRMRRHLCHGPLMAEPSAEENPYLRHWRLLHATLARRRFALVAAVNNAM
ncbi:hypothetical protein D3C87_1664730 [compost metagenome]